MRHLEVYRRREHTGSTSEDAVRDLKAERQLAQAGRTIEGAIRVVEGYRRRVDADWKSEAAAWDVEAHAPGGASGRRGGTRERWDSSCRELDCWGRSVSNGRIGSGLRPWRNPLDDRFHCELLKGRKSAVS